MQVKSKIIDQVMERLTKQGALVIFILLVIVCFILLSVSNDNRQKYKTACLLWQKHSEEVNSNAVELGVDDEFRSFAPIGTLGCESRVQEWLKLEK